MQSIGVVLQQARFGEVGDIPIELAHGLGSEAFNDCGQRDAAVHSEPEKERFLERSPPIDQSSRGKQLLSAQVDGFEAISSG